MPVKKRSSLPTNEQPLTPPRQCDMSLSPNPTTLSHSSSSLKVPVSPPHSTTAYSDGKLLSITFILLKSILTSFYHIDGWMQQPSLNSISSPSSDYYDSFNSTSSHSIKQEPATPNFSPADVINNLMFNDESSNQMKTEYNAGKVLEGKKAIFNFY